MRAKGCDTKNYYMAMDQSDCSTLSKYIKGFNRIGNAHLTVQLTHVDSWVYFNLKVDGRIQAREGEGLEEVKESEKRT